MKKRLISLLLTLALVLGCATFIVSCDDTETETESGSIESTETVSEKETDDVTDKVTDKQTEAQTQKTTESATAESDESETSAKTESESADETETKTDSVTESGSQAGEEQPSESASESVSESASESAAPTETETQAPTETETQAPTETETQAPTETEPETDPETEPEEETDCYHPYAAKPEGHWKPACPVCGKKDGKVQDHEYEERVEDEGDLIVYSLRCTVCKYRAYEQEVPYEINAFYSAGELAYTDTSSANLVGAFAFDSGIGYASYSSETGGATNVIVLSNGEVEDPSGKYLVMKVRPAKSQSSFTASIKSVGADGSLNMTFSGLKAGWATIIVDVTKAVGEGKDKEGNVTKLGYQPDISGEYYLGDFRLGIKAGIGESFDIGYVMFCDSIEDARNFTSEEKVVMIYDDILNKAPETDEKQCVDENGNPIVHEYIINDDGTHTLKETCYQCGLAAVENEPHTYNQIVVDGDYTYACGACGHLQFGANVNKYIAAQEIATTASTYYKITKNGLLTDPDGFEYASFSGQGTTAQILFARNNSVSSPIEEASAFDVGKGNYFIMKLRTTHPSVSFGIQVGTDGDGTNNFRFPTALSTAGEWAVYVVDFAAVIPANYAPDESGNYRITQFYYHIGAADFTKDVTYDVAYTAFVDSWEEVDALVEEDTIINVSGANKGSIVKTEDKSCLGEHGYGVEVKGEKCVVVCATCGYVLKEYSVKGADAFFPAEVLATMGTMNGTLDVELQYGDDGEGFVHLDNMKDNGPIGGNWMGWNLFTGMSVEAGRFMVIKFRIGENGLGQNFLKFYTGTSKGVENEGQGLSIKASEDGQWHTVVVDVYTRIGDPSVNMIANASGKFEYQELQIRPFSTAQTKTEPDDWMDIAYIAFCDQLSDLPGFIGEETYEWSVSDSEHIVRDTASGGDDELPEIEYDPNLPVVSEHKITETSQDNGDGTTTYSYSCSHCDEIAITKTVPTGLGTYLSTDYINTAAKIYYQMSAHQLDTDGTRAYTRFLGDDKIAQAIWLRNQKDCDKNTFTGDAFEGLELNAGKGRYMLIKARTNTPGQNFQIVLSTTEKSSPTAIWQEGMEGKYDIDGKPLVAGATYATDTGYSSVKLPFNLIKSSEWAVYVIDLESALPEYYVEDAEGNYVLDTFYFHIPDFAGTTYIDVEHIMFLEKWEDVNKATDFDKVVKVTGKNGEGSIVDSTTGACAAHTGVLDTVDGKYVVVCGICGVQIVDYGVSTDKVGAFLPAEHLLTNGSVVGSFDREYMLEDGVSFVRISNSDVNADGWTGFTPIGTSEAANKGRYVVMKFRIGENGLGQSVLQCYASTVASALKPETFVSVKASEDGQWHTVVIDLATRIKDPANYFQPDADGSYYVRYFQIRPFSMAQERTEKDDYMDIAYIAVVDDLAKLSDVVKEDTYEWSVNETNSQIRNTADNSCFTHSIVETVEGNTYTYACTSCSEINITKTVPASVTKYISPGNVINGAAVYYNVNGSTYTGKGTIGLGEEPYATTHGTNGGESQILWARSEADYTDVSGDPAKPEYMFSVGNADKLVIRARTSSATEKFRIDISTTGKSGNGYVAPSEGVAEVKPTTQGYVSVYVPIEKMADEGDGWATYVIDLAAVIPDYYVAVEGEYVIDTFYFHFQPIAATTNVDVAYVAFVDGDWAEIDELVDETVVCNITNKTGEFTKVNVADGSAVTE